MHEAAHGQQVAASTEYSLQRKVWLAWLYFNVNVNVEVKASQSASQPVSSLVYRRLGKS